MIDFWGYDIGDFQPDIVSDIETPTVPEPEFDWDSFFKSIGEEYISPMERYDDLPYPIGSVGTC
jgi:hypothetical protein